MTQKALKKLAIRELGTILELAESSPTLRKRGPRVRPWQVDVELVSAARMRALNFQYRGKDYATDVLSFEAPLAVRSVGMLGELVICLPVLERQAKEQGHRALDELRVLLVHGVLHLLGMDHERSAAESRLQRGWESRLLRQVGGPPGLIERVVPRARVQKTREA